MDQVLGLLDKSKGAAVVASMVDWASAFDRQDPTLAIKKFLNIGVRPSLIPTLVSYLSGRKMKVRFNGTYSTNHSLPGGGAQGTLLGVLQYLIQSNDNANCVNESMRYKFVDDLTILELVLLSQWLSEYNFKQHVASDIGIEENFISPENLSTQLYLNDISKWTQENKMQLNENKSNYMVFTRSNTEVSTRLAMNGQIIDRIEETKLLGVWLSTYLDWTRNTKEICRKSYARMTMLTKLKYVGVPESDLLEIYILYIRSVLEYCSTVWHSTLTVEQNNDIEKVQKLSLRIILGSDYTDYQSALDYFGLESLASRREQKCLQFGLKSLLHPKHSEMFPLNPRRDISIQTRHREHFHVNKANSEYYRMSTIPYIQRKLNDYVSQKKNGSTCRI